MNWFDKWFYKQAKKAWQNKNRYEEEIVEKQMALAGQKAAQISIDRSAPEGDEVIRFELSTAVGGRILNVRRYDRKTDRNDTTTYVIPSGEDIGARVAKILNLEMIK